MKQQRKPAVRLFHGLAGSAFQQSTPAPQSTPQPTVGRPRKYASAAERQAEYRKRLAGKLKKLTDADALKGMFLAAAKQMFPDVVSLPDDTQRQDWLAVLSRLDLEELEEVLAAIRGPETESLVLGILNTLDLEQEQEAEAELKEINKPHESGEGDFMRGAPSGKGQLVTGGYGSAKIEQVGAARERKERTGELDGPSGGAEGHQPHFENLVDTKEYISQFMKHLSFGKKSWKLSESEIEKIAEAMIPEYFVNEGTTQWSDGPHPWGDTFRCVEQVKGKPCDTVVQNWQEAAEHIRTVHPRAFQEHVKAVSPRWWSTRKGTKCTEEEHERMASVCKARGEGTIHCGRCKKKLVS
jgi:hypothetical protein